MIVNQQALRGIYTSFKVIFQKAFEQNETLWQRIATLVPSETGEENYKWLGKIPHMREWIGDRQIQNLSASDYTIKNKDFELTVSVPRSDIEDDRIGLYKPIVESIGQSAKQHPDELVFKLLPGGFVNKCYDGKAFFASDHVVGDGKKAKSYSNKGSARLSRAAYRAARKAIMSLVDENGDSLNLVPDLLIVAPANEDVAKEILLADEINGTTNTDKGTAELMVATQLAGKNENSWYLLCTKRPIKPFIFQERKKVQFHQLTGETDEPVFMRAEYIYGADSRDNAGYGLWQMAYGSDGSDPITPPASGDADTPTA